MIHRPQATAAAQSVPSRDRCSRLFIKLAPSAHRNVKPQRTMTSMVVDTYQRGDQRQYGKPKSAATEAARTEIRRYDFAILNRKR
jgi:hypothetical protein